MIAQPLAVVYAPNALQPNRTTLSRGWRWRGRERAGLDPSGARGMEVTGASVREIQTRLGRERLETTGRYRASLTSPGASDVSGSEPGASGASEDAHIGSDAAGDAPPERRP